jgi:hypothetical protein
MKYDTFSQWQSDNEQYRRKNAEKLDIMFELIPKPESLDLGMTHIILDHFDVFVFVIHES